MLQGKTVKIDDPTLLTYFYPDYKVKSKLSFLDRDNNVIYVGHSRNNLKEWLSSNTKSYISTVGIPEIDLTSKTNLLKFVFSQHGREPSESVLKQVESFDDNELLYCLKIYWQSGIWPYHINNDDVNLYNLFQSTIGSVISQIGIYMSLLNIYPFYVIESSFLTFMVRAKTVEDQEVSPYYKRLLKSFILKSGSKIKPVVLKYAMLKGMDERLRFLMLLLNLR